MKRAMMIVGALVGVSGCATTEVEVMPPQHQFDRYWAENGIRQVGERYVHEGHIQNGVIVTPSTNWFFGQGEGFDPNAAPVRPEVAQGYDGVPVVDIPTEAPAHPGHFHESVHPPQPNGGQMLMVENHGLDPISQEFGGGTTPGSQASLQRGTTRSLKEMQALEKLDVAGRYVEDGLHAPYARLDDMKARQLLSSPEDGTFNPLRILGYLEVMDPDTVTALETAVYTDDLRAPVPLFDLGKFNIKPDDALDLRRFADELHGYGNLVVVGGYTDPTGSTLFNKTLAHKRAQAVAEHLVKSGMKEQVLYLFGRPQCCYVQPNDTEKNRALNRRAEISLRGQFVRVDASNSESLAKGLARVFKTMGGRSHLGIRVYGVAPDEEAAVALATDMQEFLTAPQVGVKNVGIGEAAQGSRREVILEIVKNFGVNP